MGKGTETVFADTARLLRRDLRRGTRVSLPVRSGSMVPYLVPGGNVEIEQRTWRACRRGDIVVFWDGERLTAHRLLLTFHRGGRWIFWEKGDANPLGRWIDAERVLGVVTGAWRPDGTRVDLCTRSARRRGTTLASKHLFRDVWSRLLWIPRELTQWLARQKEPVGSA